MTRKRSIRALLHRLGQEVDILARSESGVDEFNNPESVWTKVDTSQCVRTYPNRNTEVETGGGPFERDRPVFIFSHGEEPPTDARIRYGGILYEMQSETVYDSHVAIFGNRVDN